MRKVRGGSLSTVHFGSTLVSITAQSRERKNMAEKLPLGVMPRDIWLEHRILDLARAIHEYTAVGKMEPVKAWAWELMGLSEQHARENPEKTTPAQKPASQNALLCQGCGEVAVTHLCAKCVDNQFDVK